VLVNPRIAVPTKDVFARLAAMRGNTVQTSAPPPHASNDNVSLDTALEEIGNDLEAPAIALQPIIAEVLAALADQPACRRARMSGSGATCFALFPSARTAAAAARQLRAQHPGWWVRACVLNRH
jgi:4-diphosphocytidyl-2-C-methyl-D-erythritol kinase